ANQLFAGGATLGNTAARLLELFADDVFDFTRDLAPEVPCVAKFDLVVFDPDVLRRFGLAVDDDAIPTGALQLSTPISTRFCFAEAVVQRRLGANRMAARPGHRGARDHAGG